MTITEFPVPTRQASRSAYDTRFATPAALLASSDASRATGAEWVAGRYPYQEQPSDATDHHLATAAGVKLKVLATDAIYSVDAFGAVGDCPTSGSTSGATDDSDAIEAAFRAVPAGGVVRFTAGKCYMMTRQIDVRGKGMVVDFNHCMIRAGDSTVWGLIMIGGESDASPVDRIEVRNGTFDGNRDRQRYWPSLTTVPTRNLAAAPGDTPNPDPLSGYQIQYTTKGGFATNDGGATYRTWTDDRDDTVYKHAIVNRTLSTPIAAADIDIGTRFYENSPVNGAVWDEDWINGANNNGNNGTDPINLRGQGNNGIIWILSTETVVAENLRFQNFVRNGLSLWGVKYAHVSKVQGRGQLPTTFFEIGSTLFLPGAEASCIKIGGPAKVLSANKYPILGGYYPHSVFLSEIDIEGGAIPVFIRSNEPKSANNGIHVYMDRCRFVGIARELWFELCSSVMISNTDIICAEYPDSFDRRSPAVYIDGRTTSWGFTNCHVRGRINSNAMQSVERAFFTDSRLEEFSGEPQRPLVCHVITGSVIVTRGAGILARRIVNSEIYCDDTPDTDGLRITGEVTNSTFGRERFKGVQERVFVAAGQSSCTLSATATHIDTVYVRQPGFSGNRWFVVDESHYTLTGGTTLTFEAGAAGFLADGEPVEVDVHHYAEREDTFTLTGAADATHDLTQDGGVRTQDIVSIRLNGVAIPHEYEVADVATGFHWRHQMQDSGRMRITLVNSTASAGAALVVKYKPKLWPYRAVSLAPTATKFDATMVNSDGITQDATCEAVISGLFEDISGPAAIRPVTGTKNVRIRGAVFRRLMGGMVCCFSAQGTFERLVIDNVRAEDWAMEYLWRRNTVGDLSREYLIGGIRDSSQGVRVTRHLEITDLTATRTRRQSAAYATAGRNRGDQLRSSARIVMAGNRYIGSTPFVVEPGVVPVGQQSLGTDVVVT